MAAVADLTEFVERAAAAEKAALASKWKDQSDLQALIHTVRKAAKEQRRAISLDTDPDQLSPRWADLRQNYLDCRGGCVAGGEFVAGHGPGEQEALGVLAADGGDLVALGWGLNTVGGDR